MKVCVLGLGYIGLPTASLIASRGTDVHGVDVSKKVVDTINRGEIHIVEPDLDIMVRASVMAGKLKAFTEPAPADVFILAVPTPFITSDVNEKIPDLSYVESAVDSIIPMLEKGNLVILESTSPVNTTDNIIVKKINQMGLKAGEDVFVAHCPERVLPGHILKELIENDRIIGGVNDKSSDKAIEFYSKFINGKCIKTNARTAELAKLVENSYRDVNIAFANELSLICDIQNINVWELITLANKHPRVNILKPGPGVGGHCIAVDPWFIVHSNPKESKLIRGAREVNLFKTEYILTKVKQSAEKFKNPKIACFGLSYKADIDDLRESPALEISKKIKEAYPETFFVEPNLKSDQDFQITEVDEAIHLADIIVFLVAHQSFLSIPRSKLKEKVVLDICGIFPNE